MLQPPYSPDLAPCDFFLFQKVKLVVSGHHFDSTAASRAPESRPSTTSHKLCSRNATNSGSTEKVCAGTRDVLWRWPHFSWWINKIKLLLDPVSLFYIQTPYSRRFAAVFFWLCAVCSFKNKIKWICLWASNTGKFLFFGRLGLRLSELRPLMRPLSISRMIGNWVWRTVRMEELRTEHWIAQKYMSYCHPIQIQNPIKIVVEVNPGFCSENSTTKYWNYSRRKTVRKKA